MPRKTLCTFLSLALLVPPPAALSFQSAAGDAAKSSPASEVDASASPMRPYIERFAADRRNLLAYYNIHIAAGRTARLKRFYEEWSATLASLDFDALPEDGKIDYVLFRNHLARALKRLDFETRRTAEAASFLPFSQTIVQLEESRRDGMPMQAEQTAAALTQLSKDIEAARKAVEAQLQAKTDPAGVRSRKVAGNHAADQATQLRDTLRSWYRFYDNYDPIFTWWSAEPYKTADTALDKYSAFLRERVAGVKPAPKPGETSGTNASGGNAEGTAPLAKPGETDDIVGSPLGREALLDELAFEMIPYTPEELIDLAYRQLAWCESEMKRASREMGLGDDWKKALEKVKTMHVEPGRQPELIRELEKEAEKFLDDRDLVTIPPIARETWRMEMMSPERQLVTPFFTGGDVISVSYPVAAMTYEQKMMTMRGNNIPFSRATVFHELIPGHELQGYMASIFRPYRQEISETPFLIEGWALYWELLLWDMQFQKTPEDRVGALFWRMHRCARIIFSLSFHLGKMTPDECIQFLVDRVGHERENAIGEVRRSFGGDYPPLYQAAYLLGGMQLYALRKQLVGPGRMTDRQFHDAVLRENEIPIELIRASLTHQNIRRDFSTTWHFDNP
jgi:uncharacterized protein (DUF885 family)